MSFTSNEFNNANGVSLSNASIISQWEADNPRPPSHSPNLRDWNHEHCELLRRLFLPTSPPRLTRVSNFTPLPFQGITSTTEVFSPTSSLDSFPENPIPFPSNLSPIHSSSSSDDNWMDIHNDHTFGGNSNELTSENEPNLFGQEPPVITSLLSFFDLAS